MRRDRPAYTLMEVILVLAVLVGLAALAYPIIDSLQAGPRLTAATDLVRQRLTEARTRAVKERVPYRFAVKDGTGSFRIAPDTVDFWDDGGPSSGEEGGWVFEGSLPESVTFSVPDEGGSEWRPLATFQPDGTAKEDAELTFQTRGAAPATLRLRATTGAITTAEAGNQGSGISGQGQYAVLGTLPFRTQ